MHGDTNVKKTQFSQKTSLSSRMLDLIESSKERKFHLMYVCPCIIYEIDERYPLDATIYLLL